MHSRFPTPAGGDGTDARFYAAGMPTRLPLQARADPAARAGLTSGFALRPVSTREDWLVVRALRLAALLSCGDLVSHSGAGYADAHDEADNAVTYLLARNGRPIASTRSSVRRAPGSAALPAMDAFAEPMRVALGAAATVVEASLTVTEPSARVDGNVALFHLFKAHMLACECDRADWLVTAVRESQIGYYRRMFNMEILTGAESVPGMALPRVLMGLRYREQSTLLFKRFPALAVSDADARRFATTGEISFQAERRAGGGTRRVPAGRVLVRD